MLLLAAYVGENSSGADSRARACTREGGRERPRWKGDCNERALDATHRVVYLHAKVHFVQVYNHGFPGRQAGRQAGTQAGRPGRQVGR